MKICVATNNADKLKEIKNKLGNNFELLSLADIGHEGELPENQKTLEGNSLEKAEYIYRKFEIDCIADDTGLEVVALDGKPGVYSSRYAGPQRNAEDNMNLLLAEMEGQSDRRAQFRTVITLILKGKTRQFEGAIQGRITEEKHGVNGFGYDPVFIPKGHETTFSEMSLEEKNQISHRAIAVEKLTRFLSKKSED